MGSVNTALEEVLGEDQFNGRFERLGHSDHDVGAEYPKDVVYEETAQQNTTGDYVIQMQQLHAIDREGQTEEVVGDPVLNIESKGQRIE